MTSLHVLKFVHLLAAAVWTGGLITLTVLVPVLRRGGASVELLRAAARAFARLSWTAMAILIVTGVGQVQVGGWPWSYGALHRKLGLVALAVALAAVHQVTARRSSPAARGLIQGAIGLVSIAVFAAAVLL
jgi:putative copper export protein